MPDSPLTPDEIRTLLRECVTVVKPGELLVLRVNTAMTPNQMREYQEALDWMVEEKAPGVKVLAVQAESGQILQGPWRRDA